MMLLSLPRLAVFLTFVVIGVASENVPAWCSSSTTVSGSISINKGDGCDSVEVDDLSHCLLVATGGNCVINSGDPNTGSDYFGKPCCIIPKTSDSWNIQDNGVCTNPCVSSTSSTTTSETETSSSKTETTSGTEATTETTSTTETSGSRGGVFAVTVGAAAASSMIIAFIL
jgi:hypothetical protein